jgi:hypothetical protein
MNPRTRQAALYAIGAIAILASMNALAHSYAGLYDWAVHHRLGGWQAMSWPAEIDVFLAVGELALYVAYLDGWPTRQRIWPWATALIGLAVSVAGNIGHIQAEPGHPVIMADRMTAATSPIAAFAGLAIGLLVLKMTRKHAVTQGTSDLPQPVLVLAHIDDIPSHSGASNGREDQPGSWSPPYGSAADGSVPTGLLRDAQDLYIAAAARGQRMSQRALAQQLRERGHRFSNDQLRLIAESTRLAGAKAS